MNSSHDASELSRAPSLLPLITGAFASQAVCVAAELGLADLVQDEPRQIVDLAAATQSDPSALARLLRALSALGLFVESAPGIFASTPLGRQLRTGASGSLRNYAMFAGSEEMRRSWSDLAYSVRTGASAFQKNFGMDTFEHRAAFPDRARLFNRAMAEITGEAGRAAAAAFDFSVFATIIDIGGGNGTLLSAILPHFPRLSGAIFDIPSGTLGASETLAVAGVAGRCRVLHGDFFKSIPDGADAYILKSIIHDWDDAGSVHILKNCAAAMKPESKLLLFELILPEQVQFSPVHRRVALSDLNMLVMTTGRERNEAQFRKLLDLSGLRFERAIPTASTFSLIQASLAG